MLSICAENQRECLQSSEQPPAVLKEIDQLGWDKGVENTLLMFMRVHSCILLGSWCCRCTEAARNTKSSKGLSYISCISCLAQARVMGSRALLDA